MKSRRFICLILAAILLSLTGCSTVSGPSGKPETDLDTSIEFEPDSETNNESEEKRGEPESETNNESEETRGESESETNNESEETRGESEVKKTYSILFIGNSYTYYNDMPTAIFENLAKAAGYDVEITSITKGGYTLEQMADPNDIYGAQVEKALTGTKKYDYVILQEQSARPATELVENFYGAVRNLSARIVESGATPILYSTWGRKTGSNTLAKYGWTNESMTWKLAAAYEAIGKELNIPVAYVGLAFYDVYTGPGTIDLYLSDKSHPSYAGSYLAAATLFAEIFNEDPIAINYNGSLTEEDASMLREAASRAVFQKSSIPDEYKTTSQGMGD